MIEKILDPSEHHIILIKKTKFIYFTKSNEHYLKESLPQIKSANNLKMKKYNFKTTNNYIITNNN